MHDIGKNLVKIMFEGVGFHVFDLGIDVPADRFIAKVKEEKPQILAMSALLTTTMTNMEKVIKAVEKEGLREGLLIMVGGAPVTESFAKSIGADLRPGCGFRRGAGPGKSCCPIGGAGNGRRGLPSPVAATGDFLP